MKYRFIAVSLFATAASLLSACSEDINSSDVHTTGIYASMDVQATADNASTVTVVLKAGGANSNTYVDLTSGDTLVSTIDSANAKTLSRQKNGGTISYVTNYSVANVGTENAHYNIAFNRDTETDAPASYIDLPAPVSNFTADKTSFSRATEQLTLTWDSVNTADSLALRATGDCIDTFSASTSDVGIYTVNAGALKSDGTPSSCDVAFTLSRSGTGTLDPVFVDGEGGKFTATQKRSKTVSTTP